MFDHLVLLGTLSFMCGGLVFINSSVTKTICKIKGKVNASDVLKNPHLLTQIFNVLVAFLGSGGHH